MAVGVNIFDGRLGLFQKKKKELSALRLFFFIKKKNWFKRCVKLKTLMIGNRAEWLSMNKCITFTRKKVIFFVLVIFF